MTAAAQQAAYTNTNANDNTNALYYMSMLMTELLELSAREAGTCLVLRITYYVLRITCYVLRVSDSVSVSNSYSEHV